MTRLIAVLVLAFSLSACESLSPILSLLPGGDGKSLLERMEETGGVVDDKVVDNAVKGVPIYCKLPQAVRGKARGHINDRPEIAGNKIAVWCVGDDPVTLGEPAT